MSLTSKGNSVPSAVASTSRPDENGKQRNSAKFVAPPTPLAGPNGRPNLKLAPRKAQIAKRGMRLDAWFISRLVATADWALALTVAAFAVRFGYGVPLGAVTLSQAAVIFGAVLCLKSGLWLADAYADHTQSKASAERAVGGASLGVIAAIGFAAFMAPDSDVFIAIGASAPLAGLFIAGLHAGISALMRDARARGALCDTAVIVGATDAAERLIARNAVSGHLRIAAVFDDRADRGPDAIAGVPVLGSIEDLLAWDHLPDVDRIVVCVSQKAEARVKALIERLRVTPNRVDLVIDLDGITTGGVTHVETLGDLPFAKVSGGTINNRRAIAKRAQDLLIGLPLLIIFSPIMAAIAVLVKMDSPGPILFRQRREGFNNRVITVLKFRTMRNEPAPEAGVVRQVTANDPRVTKLGAILRSSSLDELPQLFNVILGDMSLVGPRPHAVGMRTGEVATSSIVTEYAHRHRIKPGLTGWAQVNGSRGPIDSAEEVRERVNYDLEYIRRSSFWFDLWIMIRTGPALLGDRLRIR
jgi:polysaccharide biosynthesis protein PslA